MTVYRFDPQEMAALAAVLRRAAESAGTASRALLMTNTYGLPPEAQGLVESQTRALWLLLARADTSLAGAAGYLTRMAGAVRRADDPKLRAAGLDLVRVTKGGEVVIKELGDRANRTRTPLGNRAHRWATLFGALTGSKAVDLAVGWSEWRSALRQANVSRGSSTAQKVSAALRQRTASAIDEMNRLQPHKVKVPFPPDDGKWKQWARRVAGLSPGPAGDVADLVSYLSASRKLRADEPQTGVSQALTDVRDFVDLVGASNHLAADVYIKHPLTAPAAVINEGIGLGADAVVLTMDTTNEARKGLGRTIDNIAEGFQSLGRPPWAW